MSYRQCCKARKEVVHLFALLSVSMSVSFCYSSANLRFWDARCETRATFDENLLDACLQYESEVHAVLKLLLFEAGSISTYKYTSWCKTCTTRARSYPYVQLFHARGELDDSSTSSDRTHNQSLATNSYFEQVRKIFNHLNVIEYWVNEFCEKVKTSQNQSWMDGHFLNSESNFPSVSAISGELSLLFSYPHFWQCFAVQLSVTDILWIHFCPVHSGLTLFCG